MNEELVLADHVPAVDPALSVPVLVNVGVGGGLAVQKVEDREPA